MIRHKFNMNDPIEREDYYAYKRAQLIFSIVGLVLIIIVLLTYYHNSTP